MVSVATWETLTATRVMSKKKILLLSISTKLQSLSNASHVLLVHINLVSSILLDKAGLKSMVRDDNIIISHNGVFVGKECLNRGLFILNIASEAMNRNVSCSACVTKSFDLWHGGLCYVNFIKQVKNIFLLPYVMLII